ncbi:MAG: ribosome small subunit-dependent GTPase A [Bacteroidetes bacterium]|nr:ribosome small subunit-dependent GTPase A [Bacteroidota bacterium]
MTGRVMRSTGSWYEVQAEDGQRYLCRLKGKFRLEGFKESNPVAVGDRVRLLQDNKDMTIDEILPRDNHVLRQSVKRTGHSHVLAANVDQVLILATLHQPRTSLGFIDRVLVTAESFRIPQILAFNKSDLLSPEERTEVEGYLRLYRSIGVTSINISLLTEADLALLGPLLEHKTTLVAGHSGVGKSTLLNRLSPGIQQTVREVSEVTRKGTHTTTYAEMFSIDHDTYLIDTPGIKEWGLVEMEPQEISDYFPEMRELRLSCRFGARCLHLQEPGCAVLTALKSGAIADSRYQSYVRMVSGEDSRK